ncbi:MAG TPA: metal-dependent transcriptional regulator [Methanoregulaceae archaeon]|nr:metal-dependent transcriptional regulator [Methanoregulaceae archaeon]
MTGGGDRELSPRRMEYLKFLLERGEPVTNADLAARFGVDPSTSTRTVRALVETGLVEHESYGGIALSGRGRRCAEFLMRRHRLLALAFARLGMEPATACAQAARCEDRIPRDVVNTICAALGHPSRSACGDIAMDRGCCAGREE